MEQNLTFSDLGLSTEILQALEKKGYGYPTKIQQEAIPPLMEWKDVIAKAPTGTGKTFAFGIPMIEHIDAESHGASGSDPRADTRAGHPDRRRAARCCWRFTKRTSASRWSTAAPRSRARSKQLQKCPQIVVATPGRLMDHYKRKTLRLDKVKTVILDEADRMLDMGFFEDVTQIIEKITQPAAIWACFPRPSPRRS